MKRRKVCVVTATRAEYGLLFWLLHELRNDPAIELQLIVTGTHLSKRYGFTVSQIEKDGFAIDSRIELPLESDSASDIGYALAAATVGMVESLERLKPELLVLLGDRYEILAAAQSAMLHRIPIAHLHGGEATEGVIDEAIRHAVTKMSHLHFVSASEFRDRVIQLGENPDRVWVVGATGLDNVERLNLVPEATLAQELGISLRPPKFLVTYHPVTLEKVDQGLAMCTLLEVLEEWGGSIVITGVNADTGSHSIRRVAGEFVEKYPTRVVLVESLGALRYLSMVKAADAVIGNSSSGLLEAPSLGTPTVDIGDRQKGRLRAPSVVHCSEERESIKSAVETVLQPDFRVMSRKKITPYGKPGAAKKIAEVIRNYPLENLVFKQFHNMSSIDR
ncbi:UDP-N-acetylglucosamine 2-epimerase [Sedimenticola sp.]|uniref:UDP-N-acetylglucosamine 2-epimerase n=1 Tax=Sedimenticola sp. TaxID=1940285 RepID=UPI003D148D89